MMNMPKVKRDNVYRETLRSNRDAKGKDAGIHTLRTVDFPESPDPSKRI